jgi:hypothetical protein
MPTTIALEQPISFLRRIREISMFFDGTDKVHNTMRRVAGVLESAQIPYAIVGGMAVNAHGHARTTRDVDFLITSEGFSKFLQLIAASNIRGVPGRPRRFVDETNGVTFDFLIAGMYPGSGEPGPVVYPDPRVARQTIAKFQVVPLAKLIELKLAATRHQDFADVVNLISIHDLDERFAQQLDPSVRGDYIECLEEKRREDRYEARQDEQFRKSAQGSGNGPPQQA